MRSGSWTYSLRARCRLEDAVALLSDITKQGALHPLIIKVDELEPVEGALTSYAITDRLPLGPFSFRITYYADTLSLSETEIVTVARQKPKTTLRNVTRFTVEGDEVVIAVHVEMTAPTLLLPYGLREGRAAHLKLAERIKAALETPGSDSGSRPEG